MIANLKTDFAICNLQFEISSHPEGGPAEQGWVAPPLPWTRGEEHHRPPRTMSWQQTEFILKGVYLGLLLYVGLQLHEATWGPELGYVALCTFGGLALFLGVAAV